MPQNAKLPGDNVLLGVEVDSKGFALQDIGRPLQYLGIRGQRRTVVWSDNEQPVPVGYLLCHLNRNTQALGLRGLNAPNTAAIEVLAEWLPRRGKNDAGTVDKVGAAVLDKVDRHLAASGQWMDQANGGQAVGGGFLAAIYGCGCVGRKTGKDTESPICGHLVGGRVPGWVVVEGQGGLADSYHLAGTEPAGQKFVTNCGCMTTSRLVV